MAFEAAVLSRLVAIREGERFNQQCREQISPLKEERDALASLFVNLLTVPGAVPLLQLSDGKYVSLKTTTTTRAITEARLRAAIDAITPAQLGRLEGRLVEAVEENLLDECTAITHRPVVTVARPPHVSAQRPPARADPTVERSAQRLIAIDERLKVLRQRQTAGRAQCRQAVGETDEVLHDWMAADGHHRRRIEVRPERAASPPAPAPALPALPLVGGPASAAPAAAAAPVRITSTTAAPAVLEVRRPHPRPNRVGRAPSIAAFVAALAKLPVETTDQLLPAALELFASLRKPTATTRRTQKLTVALL